ncbi:hypothetical protein AB1L30_07545 [Bremerella sp. JC817]|uniref:hypothetical protein n=1 Tax=Bremerella sp. JC817 TaxID=3231756 RepID=UPI00345A50C9
MSTAVASEFSLRQGVRIRPDLVFARRLEADGETWIVKDPVTLRYFHFGSAEVFVMRHLDGHSTPAEIQSLYEEQFAPRRISTQEIVGFCHSLHQRGLLIASAENQADTLLQRKKKQAWFELASLPLQVLSIRLPGIDPESWLKATSGAVSWLFHKTTVTIVLMFASLALLLGLLNWEAVTAKLPSESAFFRGENLVLLLVTFALVKVLHELGHAYCCKAMGGECHQIGVLLMVFTPAMYCDVSDAWLFPRRWPRIMVSAAGMYVEVILATMAFTLWYFANPGPIRDWLLNIVFVCGVSTVVVNANPLLRYDGYYILSDWWNLPNLGSRASEALWTPVRNWFFRHPVVAPPEPQAGLLRTYAILAIVYRTLVFGFILWFLYQACRQNDLLSLWYVVVGLFAVGLLLKPTMRLGQWIGRPKGRGDAMNRARVIGATVVLMLIVAGLGMIPIPSRVHVPAIAEIDSDHRVYAQVDGRVVEAVAPQSHVQQGDVLAVLVNEDLADQQLVVEGEIELQRQHLESLKLRSNNSPEAAAQIPTAEAALNDLQKRREVILREQGNLSVKAPVDGVVIAPPYKIERGSSDRFLSHWTGSPLDPANRGCLLERGELLCLIGDAEAVQARLLIHQDQIELIREGDPVSILFDGTSTHSLSGKLSEISTDQSTEVPRNLSSQESLGVRRRDDGSLALERGAFSATVTLDEHAGQKVLPGTTGNAVIVGRPQTVWQIVARFFQLNFRFFS